MELDVGQVWKECDPHFERFVRITSLRHQKVEIRTVRKIDGFWQDAPRSRVSYADRRRFDGKRGGYEFVE